MRHIVKRKLANCKKIFFVNFEKNLECQQEISRRNFVDMNWERKTGMKTTYGNLLTKVLRYSL